MVSRLKQRKRATPKNQTKRVSSANNLFNSIIQDQNQKQQSQLLLLRNQRERKHQKRVSFDIDSKSYITESTSAASSSTHSDTPSTNSALRNSTSCQPVVEQQPSPSASLKGKQKDNAALVAADDAIDKSDDSEPARSKKEAAPQPEQHDVSKLLRSNRALQTENAAMKKDLREMKTKLTAMERSLQRTQPEKEKELLDAIEALHKVTIKQGQKIAAYKTSRKKLKSKISRRDAQICQLKKEHEQLKSASADTQNEFQVMHREVAGLQQELCQSLDYADECKAQLEREKEINRDLTSRLIDLESQLQTMDVDTDTPAKHIQEIMKQSSYDKRTSTTSTDALQMIGHIALLEDKIKRTRRGSLGQQSSSTTTSL